MDVKYTLLSLMVALISFSVFMHTISEQKKIDEILLNNRISIITDNASDFAIDTLAYDDAYNLDESFNKSINVEKVFENYTKIIRNSFNIPDEDETLSANIPVFMVLEDTGVYIKELVNVGTGDLKYKEAGVHTMFTPLIPFARLTMSGEEIPKYTYNDTDKEYKKTEDSYEINDAAWTILDSITGRNQLLAKFKDGGKPKVFEVKTPYLPISVGGSTYLKIHDKDKVIEDLYNIINSKLGSRTKTYESLQEDLESMVSNFKGTTIISMLSNFDPTNRGLRFSKADISASQITADRHFYVWKENGKYYYSNGKPVAYDDNGKPVEFNKTLTEVASMRELQNLKANYAYRDNIMRDKRGSEN